MVEPKTPIGQTYSDDFRGRIRFLAKNYKNREEAAKAFGAAKASLDAWIYGKNTPSFEAMIKLARSTGTSLDWLAFGVGQATEGTLASSAAQCEADSDLMSEIYLKIQDVVASHGHRLSPEQHIALTCDIYNLVMAKPDDREELIETGMRHLVIMLKGLKPPEPEPETADDKRRA